LNLGLLIVAAPFLRYLIGVHYLGTGGSLLAVGLQHASFNAAVAFGLEAGSSSPPWWSSPCWSRSAAGSARDVRVRPSAARTPASTATTGSPR
ncbi:MAG: hypothetical protein QOJ30_801, partial [Pseudonocardiales bacterium]|nr:hypothetical protein [Pseudonocardiales bacterium]